MTKQRKKHACVHDYFSPNQLTPVGFETPFELSLNPGNRWIILSNLIPWYEILQPLPQAFWAKHNVKLAGTGALRLIVNKIRSFSAHYIQIMQLRNRLENHAQKFMNKFSIKIRLAA